MFHGLQAGQYGWAALLQQVNAHQHIAVAGQGPPVAVVDLPPLGPQLDDENQLHQPLIYGSVVSQQLGVDNSQDVVHCDVHLRQHATVVAALADFTGCHRC